MSNEQPPKPVQPLNYANPAARKSRGVYTFSLISGLILGAGLLAMILLPNLNVPHQTATRLICASNLRQIGQAIFLYTDDFNGRYPNSFGDLLLTEDIGSSVFVCPDSTDTAATGPTTRAVITNLEAGGHCSYIYLGKGLTAKTVRDDIVVAYEPLANHKGSGMNVLFGDGHVEFIVASSPGGVALLKQVGAGTWPVALGTSAATKPATQPVLRK